MGLVAGLEGCGDSIICRNIGTRVCSMMCQRRWTWRIVLTILLSPEKAIQSHLWFALWLGHFAEAHAVCYCIWAIHYLLLRHLISHSSQFLFLFDGTFVQICQSGQLGWEGPNNQITFELLMLLCWILYTDLTVHTFWARSLRKFGTVSHIGRQTRQRRSHHGHWLITLLLSVHRVFSMLRRVHLWHWRLILIQIAPISPFTRIKHLKGWLRSVLIGRPI